MSEDPDLERRLEAMFASARPRREFEDELWRRLEQSRPWYQRRLRNLLQPTLRFAPALAALLVVALGASWLVGSQLLGRGSPTSSSNGSGAYQAQTAATAPAFGRVPSLAPRAEGAAAPAAPAVGNADKSAGLTFSGTLPSLPPSLPVHRYDEPSPADLSAAAARLRAQAGIPVTVAPSDLAAVVEPSFSISGVAVPPLQGDLIADANTFLSSHGLTPTFPFRVSPAGSGRQVVYGRLFDGPNVPLPEVRRSGAPAGLIVDRGDSTISISGPLDLPLASSPYPLRSATDSLSAAGVRIKSGPADFNRAQLVYLLVLAGGHGYYEPALLLTGPGVSVLAALVAPEWVVG
jgi:hypothetical protein